MGFLANPAVIAVIMQILSWIIEKKVLRADDRKFFIEFANALRARGLLDVTARFRAEDQLRRTDEMWDEIEAKEKAGKQ